MNSLTPLFNQEIIDLCSPSITARPNDTPKMRRLICEWNEKRGSEIRHHIYTATVDPNNQVFDDSRKRLIFSKILFSTLARPLHCIAALFFQSIMPLGRAVAYGIKGKIDAKALFTQTAQTLLDLIRTPLYEIAMIIVGLAGILSVPLFVPSALYKCRTLIGKIEKALLFEQVYNLSLTNCFHSQHLSELVKDYATYPWNNNLWLSNFSDTDYGKHSIDKLINAKIVSKINQGNNSYYCVNSLQDLSPEQAQQLKESLAARSLTHFARALIKHRRIHYNPFYQLVGKLNHEATYISPAYLKDFE